MRPVVRVVEAGLGPAGQVSLVVSGLADSDRLRGAWASSGATVERQGEGRLFATSTVDALVRAAGRALPEAQGRALEAAARRAVAAWTTPSSSLSVGSEVLDLSAPMVMGVLNVTPDSFADGGRLYPDDHPAAAIAAGQRLCAQGAGIVDVGGESTRPGSQPVGLEEELRRTLPVVLRLAADGRRVSIDTTKPEVARRAVEAGAVLVNDVSGGRDPALLDVVADTGVGYVLMHTRGTPADMGARTDYGDVVAEVYEFLAEGIARCRRDRGGAHRRRPGHRLRQVRAAEHRVAAGARAVPWPGSAGAGRCLP